MEKPICSHCGKEINRTNNCVHCDHILDDAAESMKEEATDACDS